MGALTINRKRGSDCISLNCFSSPGFDQHRVEIQASKKHKVSVTPAAYLNSDQSLLSGSTVSRFCRYPEPTKKFSREVHAPYTARRFGWAAELKPSGDRFSHKRFSYESMGNLFGKGRKIIADTLLYRKKDDVVIDVDETAALKGDDVSCIGEVEVVDDGREVHERLKGANDVVVNLRKLDGELTDCHFRPSSSSAVMDIGKPDISGKMLNLPSSKRDMEVSGMPWYKRLLDVAQKRNSKLSSLRFQISFAEKRLGVFHLWHRKKPEKDLVLEPFVPLTEEEESEVSWAFSNSNRRRVLVTHENSNIEITGEVLQCLRPRAWLNDEVINLHLELLKEREKREPKKFLKCHFFNTFFYKKLISGKGGYDFKQVRRWTTQKRLGYCLLECDKIFVPIHQEVHWCLAVINKKDERFQYLDSLGGKDTNVMKVLAKYIVDELKDKNGKDIDVSSWKQEFVEDLPEQLNGFDCGVFMIKYADFYSRDVGLCFNQTHMPYFRQRTAKEILRLKAD